MSIAEARVSQARLNTKEERRLLRGHLWAYRNEFAQLPQAEDGTIVDVLSDKGRLIGRGFYQAEGGIAVRLMANKRTPIDEDFLGRRVKAAQGFRERVLPGQTVYRWVFGESDGLPGFVADRYGSVVHAQTPCAFYRTRLQELAHAFLSHERVEGLRVKVCGETSTFGDAPETAECEMDSLRLAVGLEQGQKTGLFLDQRANALALRPYARGARVLDGHSYAGVWSCHAALAGARHVLGVDTSARAIELAEANARLNNVETQCTFECAGVADVLARGGRYDAILLDPPALAKSRSQTRKALGLHLALNKAAMKIIEPGGILVTSCCSHFVGREAFLETLKRAVTSAQRRAWILDVRGAAPDHPVLMAMPETAYLTCVFLRVF